jgi:hypothetical protein
MLILELVTNIEDARLTIYRPDQRPVNNISLRDIEHTSQFNNSISFIDRRRYQLNEMESKKQSLDLEAKLAEMMERFSTASDASKAALLKGIDLKLDMLDKAATSTAQDPMQFKGPRTYGKGGSRKRTAAEIAETELERNDRMAKRPMHHRIIDLTSPKPGQPRSTPFSAAGNVIRSPSTTQSPSLVAHLSQKPFTPSLKYFDTHRSTINAKSGSSTSTCSYTNPSTTVPVDDPDIVVLDIQPTGQSDIQFRREILGSQRPNSLISTTIALTENESQISSPRPKRCSRRPSIYEGEFVRPRKRPSRRD